MFSRSIITLAPALLLSMFVATTPVTTASPLAERSGETVYLSNCVENESGVQFPSSEINYYSNGANSQNGQLPTDACVAGAEFVTWERQSHSCKFSDTEVSFTSHINSNGNQVALYSYAGSGSNGFTNFNCYRDNDRLLYQDIIRVCHSIYYCLDLRDLLAEVVEVHAGVRDAGAELNGPLGVLERMTE
ncbi:hypothetical protein MMC25_002452 [Agyrium rufum]|nr:hypothetical protein [Agyrium rufum]